MTTVTMTNAAICTQKLLANPALLLLCVFIWSPRSRIIAPRALRSRASSTVTSNDSVERPSLGCFEIETVL
jgi:hypothetical protein